MSGPYAVALDVGETLIDETRIWTRWAARLGVTPLTFMGVLGGVAALGRSHRDAFEIIAPGLDVEAEMRRWAADDPTGLRNHFDADDLYPDVRGALREFARLGVRVVIGGNQPVEAGGALRAMDLEVSDILISDEIGCHKPQAEFFDAVAAAAGVPPAQILYVGDRVDNDVRAAAEAGMIPVLIRRGPWGYLQATWPDAALARFVVDDLHGVVAAVGSLLGDGR